MNAMTTHILGSAKKLSSWCMVMPLGFEGAIHAL
jgi:hypothetical protein